MRLNSKESGHQKTKDNIFPANGFEERKKLIRLFILREICHLIGALFDLQFLARIGIRREDVMSDYNVQDVEVVIRRMAEARDEALWKVLHFKCQRCGELKPIKEAIGVEFPLAEGSLRCEIWCKGCFQIVT
jgi:hypothetical protein